MKYARVVDGVVFETVELDGMTPADVFSPELADTMYEAGSKVEQGWLWADGDFHEAAPEVVDLDQLKGDLSVVVDAQAERARLKYITPGAGQAMTYQQKVDEARRLQAAEGDPNPDDYPMLSAEVGITGKTMGAVAETILASFAQWQHVGAQIEGARLGAKAKIQAAKTEKAARTASVVEWP